MFDNLYVIAVFTLALAFAFLTVIVCANQAIANAKMRSTRKTITMSELDHHAAQNPNMIISQY